MVVDPVNQYHKL